MLDSCYDMSDGERYPHHWGYTDTRFEFDGPRSVRVTGNRYPVTGHSLPGFIPFAEEVLGVPINPDEMVAEAERQPLPASKRSEGFLTQIAGGLKTGLVSMSDQDRLVHSHGQLSVDEIYRLIYMGSLPRVVDAVVFPDSEEDVRLIIKAAVSHDVCLVPYGGGTNVSGALACPVTEERMIASVDMRRMNRILEIDEENLSAVVEAGISGKELERDLEVRGYTSGHDPDSVELSTLGGWIATNASGMKKNKYGNIEDIVLEATLVTASGDFETTRATPRNSTGIQPRTLLFGSEGNFGIITKAIIKIHPLPETRRYGSLVFPNLAAGVRFLRALRAEGVLPASIRLVNNVEFRFSQALKPAPGTLKAIESKIQKFVLLKIKRFKPFDIAACTIVMEGTHREVAHQQKVIFGTAKKHGGISGGSTNGKRGYMLTFSIAYIRDFFNQFKILGETFETSVPWNRIDQLTAAVQKTLGEQARAHAIQGKPYLSYRVTQTYHTGVCIYFTMGMSGKGLDKPEEIYHQIEYALRQVILDNGGSLSHHHGIGKIRHTFLPQIQTESTIDVIRQTKKAMDARNTFGISNGIFADD